MIEIPYKELVKMDNVLTFYREYYGRNLPLSCLFKRARYERHLSHARQVIEEVMGSDTTITKKDLLEFCDDFMWDHYSSFDIHQKIKIKLTDDNRIYVLSFNNHILDNKLFIAISRYPKDDTICYSIDDGMDKKMFMVKTLRTNSINTRFIHDTMLRLLHEYIGGNLTLNKKFSYLFRNPNFNNPIRLDKEGNVREIWNN